MNCIKSSPVRFHVDGAPEVVLETSWERARNPSVGLITQLENRITALPKEVTKQEQRMGRQMSGEEAPQPTFDAEFETMRRLQRANFPFAPVAGSSPFSAPVAQPRTTQTQQARENEGIGY